MSEQEKVPGWQLKKKACGWFSVSWVLILICALACSFKFWPAGVAMATCFVLAAIAEMKWHEAFDLLAGQWREVSRRAQADEKTAELFGIFRPSQEEVNRQLAIRAHQLDQACTIQADFYAKNHHFLSDRAEGDRQVMHGALVDEERFLKAEVKGRKVNFYSLFDNIRNHGFEYLDGFRPYLTHHEVGPNHPEVVAYVRNLGACLGNIRGGGMSIQKLPMFPESANA